MTAGRVIRALAGLTVLAILLLTVNGWWADYKKATPKTGSVESDRDRRSNADRTSRRRDGDRPYRWAQLPRATRRDRSEHPRPEEG